jgi:hypothetical protein
LKGVDLLGSVAYSRLIQEADLKRAPVVQADAAVVRALDEARRRLVGLTTRVEA